MLPGAVLSLSGYGTARPGVPIGTLAPASQLRSLLATSDVVRLVSGARFTPRDVCAFVPETRAEWCRTAQVAGPGVQNRTVCGGGGAG